MELSATDSFPPTKKLTVAKLYPGSASSDEVALSLLCRKQYLYNERGLGGRAKVKSLPNWHLTAHISNTVE